MNIDDTTNSDLNGPELNSRVYTTIKDQKGWSALHVACQNGHIEVIKLLIDVGMNINDTTNSGSTPLHKACQEGHYETVKFLLDLNGQALNSRVHTTLKNDKGWLAFHLACRNGHIEVVKLFIDADQQGWSASHVACQNGHIEVVKLLIDVGMNINDTTNSGSTPLHKACQQGHYETLKFLLDLNGQALNSVHTTLKTTKDGQLFI
ncbi:unnamed protein product [Mytilus edulis]|uniref:Uncharacterized protein n=1 Tax=Mytilus edulis TaxID=6550 RepID=A0A8S3T3N2_MYTED|nr:unnamed protein product [Mytilus edulis]